MVPAMGRAPHSSQLQVVSPSVTAPAVELPRQAVGEAIRDVSVWTTREGWPTSPNVDRWRGCTGPRRLAADAEALLLGWTKLPLLVVHGMLQAPG